METILVYAIVLEITIMKSILCLIENVGPSGAERQITNLAVLLRKQGHEVEVAYYVKKEFYLPFLLENGVKGCYLPEAANPRKRFFALRKHIKATRPDTVICYSASPSMITCAMKAFGAKFNLIVSERNTTQQLGKSERLRFFLYRWANHIVPNSQSQGNFIAEHYPHLSSKVKVITNYVDTALFVPSPLFTPLVGGTNGGEEIKIICVGRLAAQKNIPRFIDAIEMLKNKGLRFRVDWYGQDFKNDYSEKCYALVKEKGLENVLFFHPQTSEVIQKYQESDVLCLPSLYEGFPNVLCEAMSCGLPVVCSRVSDVPQIMEDGVNGFIFDPLDVDDMAEKLEKIITLSEEERQKMALLSREIAVGKFSSDVFISKYLELV